MSVVGRSICFCCLTFAVVGAGCEGNNNKKSALTEQEIERLTFAQKPARSDQLIVSGELITCEDILSSPPEQSAAAVSFREKLEELARQTTLEQFLEVARPQVQQRLRNNIITIVLYKRARAELGDNVDEKLDELAEKGLRRFVFEHGNNGAAAEAALQRMGMTRASYKEYMRRRILAENLVSLKYVQRQPITHGDLLARYDELKDEYFLQPGVLQLRLIDIQVERMGVSDPNGDPARQARDLAEELRKRIDAGEDFGELARQYSHGFSREEGGLWKPRDPDALAPPYDVLARQAQEMEPGQVSDPIETVGHVFIMKIEERQERGYRPLSEVQDRVRESILNDRESQASKELNAEIARQAALVDMDRFVDYCLERFHRQANEID
jgi:parvulin-like peptidyl-prolyl isomerase